jgi:uncharacterized protein (DUF4415 family)
MSDKNIKRYSADELRAMRARGESQSDWARVDVLTEAELETSIATDPDWKDVQADWYKDAIPVMPSPKKLLSLRLDPEVVDWFRAQGPRYQTRMNAVLLAYVRARQREKA